MKRVECSDIERRRRKAIVLRSRKHSQSRPAGDDGDIGLTARTAEPLERLPSGIRSPARIARPSTPPKPRSRVRGAAAQHWRDVDSAGERQIGTSAGSTLAEPNHARRRDMALRHERTTGAPFIVAPRSAPAIAIVVSASSRSSGPASVTSSVAQSDDRCRPAAFARRWAARSIAPDTGTPFRLMTPAACVLNRGETGRVEAR